MAAASFGEGLSGTGSSIASLSIRRIMEPPSLTSQAAPYVPPRRGAARAVPVDEKFRRNGTARRRLERQRQGNPTWFVEMPDRVVRTGSNFAGRSADWPLGAWVAEWRNSPDLQLWKKFLALRLKAVNNKGQRAGQTLDATKSPDPGSGSHPRGDPDHPGALPAAFPPRRSSGREPLSGRLGARDGGQSAKSAAQAGGDGGGALWRRFRRHQPAQGRRGGGDLLLGGGGRGLRGARRRLDTSRLQPLRDDAGPRHCAAVFLACPPLQLFSRGGAPRRRGAGHSVFGRRARPGHDLDRQPRRAPPAPRAGRARAARAPLPAGAGRAR